MTDTVETKHNVSSPLRQFSTERPGLNGPAIQVSLPLALAKALVSDGPDLLSTFLHHWPELKKQIARKVENTEEARFVRELAEGQQRRERAERHRVIGIQAARELRKAGPLSPKDRGAFIRRLALRYSVEHLYLAHLIGRRRRKVWAWRKARRSKLLVQLYFAGRDNGEIAARLGLTRNYVKKLISDHAAEIEAERARRRGETGRG